jgi:hypothetical protein
VQLNGLHGVIYQKMILFITTAVKTSNPTNGNKSVGYSGQIALRREQGDMMAVP